MKNEDKVVVPHEVGINVVKERNMNGSLEQSTDELRDAYMNYKEISGQCTIYFTELVTNEEPESDDDGVIAEQSETSYKVDGVMVSALGVKPKRKKVYYFKPESLLLAHPDAQKNYREKADVTDKSHTISQSSNANG